MDKKEIKHEGLFTEIWGKNQWKSMNNIAHNYPYNPTEEDKQNYYNYYKSLENVLPCCICREHYKKHINSSLKLTMEVLENRDTLTKWLFDLHNLVNKEIGYNYNVSYDNYRQKYNSYIATHDLSLDERANAFYNYYNDELPTLPYSTLIKFKKYAETEYQMYDFAERINMNTRLIRNSLEDFQRNDECHNIIKKMRLNSIPNLEQSGKNKCLPSYHEILLMSYGCTTLTEKELCKVLDKIDGCVEKNYRLRINKFY